MDEGYEQILAYLESRLPRPVDRQEDADGIRFLAGEPPEVIVTLTPTVVIVDEFAGEWETPGRFRLLPRRIGVLHWPHLPDNELLDALAALVTAARAARRRQYRTCEACARAVPPEWMHDAALCQSCAADEGGTIH
jgi:hypothetical protein